MELRKSFFQKQPEVPSKTQLGRQAHSGKTSRADGILRQRQRHRTSSPMCFTSTLSCSLPFRWHLTSSHTHHLLHSEEVQLLLETASTRRPHRPALISAIHRRDCPSRPLEQPAVPWSVHRTTLCISKERYLLLGIRRRVRPCT